MIVNRPLSWRRVELVNEKISVEKNCKHVAFYSNLDGVTHWIWTAVCTIPWMPMLERRWCAWSKDAGYLYHSRTKTLRYQLWVPAGKQCTWRLKVWNRGRHLVENVVQAVKISSCTLRCPSPFLHNLALSCSISGAWIQYHNVGASVLNLNRNRTWDGDPHSASFDIKVQVAIAPPPRYPTVYPPLVEEGPGFLFKVTSKQT